MECHCTVNTQSRSPCPRVTGQQKMNSIFVHGGHFGFLLSHFFCPIVLFCFIEWKGKGEIRKLGGQGCGEDLGGVGGVNTWSKYTAWEKLLKKNIYLANFNYFPWAGSSENHKYMEQHYLIVYYIV